VRRAYLGLALAASLWAVVFAFKPLNFWAEISVAVAVLAGYALHSAREELRALFSYKAGMIMTGVAGALLLYGIFVIGGWAAKTLLPFASGEISSIYALGGQAPRWLLILLLAALIAPCEEIFWRGLIQSTFSEHFGDVRGFLLMAAAYALVHVWAWNLTLMGAALICGLFWGFMVHRLKSLIPSIISHVIWDLAIFVFYPVT
jgi:membrane protease YdiL (CAAX protease family)